MLECSLNHSMTLCKSVCRTTLFYALNLQRLYSKPKKEIGVRFRVFLIENEEEKAHGWGWFWFLSCAKCQWYKVKLEVILQQI